MRLTHVDPGGSRRPTFAAAAVPVVAALLMGGCAGAHREAEPASELPLRPAATATAGSGGTGVRHVVEEGQTLWRIAKAYGIAEDALARANGIDDPASLAIGQTLLVPGATAVLDVPPYPAPVTGAVSSRSARAGPAHFAWPVSGGRILSGFGAPRRTHRHQGLDIEGRHGEPVRAAESGRVVYSGSTLRGYGRTIIINHGGDMQSLYAHNSNLVAREGDRVTRGQVIARVGRTGNASTEHCHFEIRRSDVPVDPMPYLKRETESTR
jgi:murein DD-endopeptidase MepM/ murein hydrolase activator NlpD